MTEQVHISAFWKTKDLEEGCPVFVRRLGDACPGEYKGIVRGVFACDTDGHPWHYIVEMIDKLPGGYDYTCTVFPRGCVDAANSGEILDLFTFERLV